MSVIETHGLSKVYKSGGGCREITMEVGAGQVFGLLGPNGAGKSTLVKTLLGLLRPTAGSAKILGRPLGDLEARRRIGFLPEGFHYQEWLTGEELLSFHASLRRLEGAAARRRIDEVLALVNLNERRRDRVRTYSKGMQQRIGLAAALIADPDLLFLDEPTSALDPVGRKEVREIITNLRAAGKTVFLNSHLLSEVEMICDHVVIINRGRIVAQGAMQNLLAGATEVEVECGSFPAVLVERLRALAVDLELSGNQAIVNLRTPGDVPLLARTIVEAGVDLHRLSPKTQGLEDLFVRLVKAGEE